VISGRLYGRIAGDWTREEPACWSWRPPGEDDVEKARFSGYAPDGGWKYGSRDHALRLLLDFCRDRCAACGEADPRGPRLHMDHDHQTWLCRGVLCPSCNHAEGNSGGGGILLGNYRLRTPAAIVGVRVRWVQGLGPWPCRELSDLWWDLELHEHDSPGWRARESRRWLRPEVALAKRDDLTDGEVARALGRSVGAVQRRRRELGAAYWTPKKSVAA
jgi:hypothetical protein